VKESAIQNEIRIALSKLRRGKYFRVNTGRAWTGNKIARLKDGSILVNDPRPFQTGLPAGTPDLIGWTEVTITPEMVGQKMAVFTGIEVKAAKGKPSEPQYNFIHTIKEGGGISGVAYSVDDALEIIGKGAENGVASS